MFRTNPLSTPLLGARAVAFLAVLITGSLLFSPPVGAAETSPERPSILLNKTELDVFRGAVMKPGWKRDVYLGKDVVDGLKPNADLWVNRTIEIPAKGGHFHHFFCSEGDRLEMPSNQTYVPGPYRCPKCGKQYSGEKYEAALRRMVHMWLSQAALDLALAGVVETNQAYTAKCAEILVKYAKAYPEPHSNAVTGGMIYQSLDESMWVIPLAQAYDLIYDTLKTEERSEIEKFFAIVAGGIQKCGTVGNWGSWHLSAVGVVGYTIRNQALIDWATDQFRGQIRDQLGDDGLWPESVHTYHYFPLVGFIHFAEAAWHNGADLYKWEPRPGKSLAAMFYAPLDYAYPNLRLPAINDGWFEAFVPPDAYELAYHRLKDPRYAWVLVNGYRKDVAAAGVIPDGRGSRRTGRYALLFGEDLPDRATLKDAAPGRKSINFPSLGIAVFRAGHGSTLTFDYGPFLGHGHLDKMGITLFARNKLWCADYGTPGYGSDILKWYQSTLAHNTILVDRKNQGPTKESQVALWLGDEELQSAQSTTAQAYPGVKHTRTVIARPNYFVIVDSLESATNHTYDFCLRSEGVLALERKYKAAPAQAPVSWITNAVEFPVGKKISGRWTQQDDALAFVMIGSSPIKLTTAQSPAESGSRKVTMILAQQAGTSARYVTVLYPCAKAASIEASLKGSRLVVKHDGGRDILQLNAEGTQPELVKR